MKGDRSGVAVITIVRGRQAHLRRQRQALVGHSVLHIVVGMGEQLALDDEGPPAELLLQPMIGSSLPLAAARNRGAEFALANGAAVLIFLDVDCLPSDRLVVRYRDEARIPGRLALLCGAVHYLPPSTADYPKAGLEQLAPPHPSRPAIDADTTEREADLNLFWSLSFAVSAETWLRIGGFDEGFAGYGAEDTDLALRAGAAGVELRWVGGAAAFHQYHPPSWQSNRHLGDLLRNAQRFRDRHGYWPMSGWLQQLSDIGRISYSEREHRWLVV